PRSPPHLPSFPTRRSSDLEEDAAQRVVLRPQIPRFDAGAGAARHAHADERPAVGERADAVDQVLAANRVEDHVDTATVGQLARSDRKSTRLNSSHLVISYA